MTDENKVQTPPANGLTPEQVRSGLRISVVEGSFATMHLALSGGMFLTGLALFLGANSFQIGLLSAVPALVASFGFLAGFLVRRLGHRRPLVTWTAGIGRVVFVGYLPFLLLGRKFDLSLFFAVVFVSSILMTIAGTTWTSWMSELVPDERRGRYFGFRNAIHGGVGMVITFTAGRGMDWLKAGGHEMLGYAIAYSLAILCGVAAALLIARQPEPVMLPRPAVSLPEMFFGPLKERQFRRLIIFVAVWFVTGTLASPFYLVHMFKNLHFSFTAVGIYSIIGGVTGIIFHLLWGRAIDRFGSRPVTILCFSLVGIMPLLWLFATPTFRLPIWLDGMFNGLVWTGGSLGLWNLLLDLADNPARRESYFAIYGVVTGVCAFIAAMLSGVIAQALHGFRVTILGREFINYHVLFCAAGLMRFATLPLLIRVQERGSKPVPHTVRVLAEWALWRVNTGKDMLLEVLGLRSRD